MSQGETLRQGRDEFAVATAAQPDGHDSGGADATPGGPDAAPEAQSRAVEWTPADAAGDEVAKSGEESGDDSGAAAPEEEGQGETVQDPAKLVRLARMIGELLGEVREGELDESTLVRLRTHVEHTAKELSDVVSPDLHDELTRLRTLWTEASGVTQAELRIEQAQLVGWLEGVLQGIQSALSAEQAAAQQQGGQPGGSLPG